MFLHAGLKFFGILNNHYSYSILSYKAKFYKQWGLPLIAIMTGLYPYLVASQIGHIIYRLAQNFAFIYTSTTYNTTNFYANVNGSVDLLDSKGHVQNESSFPCDRVKVFHVRVQFLQWGELIFPDFVRF